jgi:hypothetical protein
MRFSMFIRGLGTNFAFEPIFPFMMLSMSIVFSVTVAIFRFQNTNQGAKIAHFFQI